MYPSDMMVTNGPGTERRPARLGVHRARRCATARAKVDGLPEGFSVPRPAALPGVAADRLRALTSRRSRPGCGTPRPRTTLDTYGHLWPDADESTRSAVGAVIAKRMDSLETTADALRTN